MQGVSDSMFLRDLAKQVRAWPALNYVATSVARGLSSTIGWQPEFLPRHLHKVGRVTCALPNGASIELWSRGDDWVSNRLFWFGFKGYEPESAGVFAALARSASVTLDVGSYVGFYTLVAARMNPLGTVHAFEPMPAIFARLQNNIDRNRSTNVVAHQAAVGETEGTADFYFSPATLLPTSSSLSRDYTSDTTSLVTTSVRVVQIDRFVQDHAIDRVDLMKIDTETTELSVLKGAEGVLRRDRPHIVCEVLKERAPAEAIQQLLSPFNYRFYLLTPDGPVPHASIEGHPEFLNYLFTTSPESELRARLS